MSMPRRTLLTCSTLLCALQAVADTAYHTLANAPFAQDWSNTGLITTTDDWSGVPSLEGYRGDNPAVGTGVDPQTVLAFVSSPLNVVANVADASNFSSGGIAEVDAGADITGNPTVAFQGSGTADAPFLLLRLNTTGCTSLQLSYKLRDIDTLETTTAQPVVAQIRSGESGNFANIAGSFVAMANNGGETLASLTLPATFENQSQVQIRWLTTNASAVDALIGIDDIAVGGSCTGGVDNPPTVASTVPANLATNVSPSANLSVQFSEPVTTSTGWFALTCDSQPVAVNESGTGSLRTIDPVSNLAFGASCTATITAASVLDIDGTPDAMAANFTFGFTVLPDVAPTVTSTVPANNASNVGPTGNLQINFSEPVSAMGSWFAISCATTGTHTAVVSGGPQNFTLNPDVDFGLLEQCSVTLTGSLIVDQDGNPDPLGSNFSFSFTTAADASNYYNGVDSSSAAALRTSLHNLIDDHTAFPYTATATDVWDILEAADQDPTDSSKVLDVYRNRKYTKVTDRSGPTGPNNYNREHTWPNSLGFNDLNGLDSQGRPYSPYVDCHMLYASASDYNSNRGNKPFDNCNAGCTENPTDANGGNGGGTGVYPGNSNWVQGSDGNSGTYEVWGKRKGDVARAILYMDIRYEGGSAATGQPEPDLIVTNNRSLIQNTPSGQVPATGYMGVLDVLLAWHAADPPDAQELLRNEVVFSYQGNRNPFIDHPEYAACLYQNQCTGGQPDNVFANSFE